MPDITIPDAAVEAVARNMFYLRETEPDQSPAEEWDDLPEPWRGEWRDDAWAALTAAAPYIAAQALRDAADAIEPTRCRVQQTCHKADAITLRARADRIEDPNG